MTRGGALHSRSPKHIILLILLLVACVSVVGGQTTDTPTSPLTISKPVADDLLAAARELHVQAEVKGDVAAAGERVTIDGPIDGYVMSAGRTVTVDGRVGNDLWAAGEVVDVTSSVSNNAMLAGRNVRLGSDSPVGYDARLAGDTVTAEGRVERNLRINAETARLGGEVGGDVVTLIGIPLAVVLLSLWLAVLLVSLVMVAYRVGGWLLERMNRQQASHWTRMAVGVLVVSLAISIPFAGWLLAIAILIAGTGAVVLERRALFNSPAVAS